MHVWSCWTNSGSFRGNGNLGYLTGPAYMFFSIVHAATNYYHFQSCLKVEWSEWWLVEASATACPFSPGGFHSQHAIEPPGKVSNSRGSALPAAVDVGWGELRNAAGLVDDCFPPSLLELSHFIAPAARPHWAKSPRGQLEVPSTCPIVYIHKYHMNMLAVEHWPKSSWID